MACAKVRHRQRDDIFETPRTRGGQNPTSAQHSFRRGWMNTYDGPGPCPPGANCPLISWPNSLDAKILRLLDTNLTRRDMDPLATVIEQFGIALIGASTVGMAKGATSQVYRSDDMQTWTAVGTYPAGPNHSAMFQFLDGVWLGSSQSAPTFTWNPGPVVSYDNGDTWTRRTTCGGPRGFVASNGATWIGGEEGSTYNAIRTTDLGNNWTQVVANYPIKHVSFDGLHNAFVAMDMSTTMPSIYYYGGGDPYGYPAFQVSTDDGLTWTTSIVNCLSVAGGEAWIGQSNIGVGEGPSAGVWLAHVWDDNHYGTVRQVKSTDGGANWTDMGLVTYPDNDLLVIRWVHDIAAWVGQGRMCLWTSTDDGATWSKIPDSDMIGATIPTGYVMSTSTCQVFD